MVKAVIGGPGTVQNSLADGIVFKGNNYSVHWPIAEDDQKGKRRQQHQI